MYTSTRHFESLALRLLDCDGGRALQQIQHELQTVGLHDGQPGYAVHVRTANARNLTAQSRKRVFFFGFRKDLEADGRVDEGWDLRGVMRD